MVFRGAKSFSSLKEVLRVLESIQLKLRTRRRRVECLPLIYQFNYNSELPHGTYTKGMSNCVASLVMHSVRTRIVLNSPDNSHYLPFPGAWRLFMSDLLLRMLHPLHTVVTRCVPGSGKGTLWKL